ncbi:hypothetical protein [Hymenobacter rubidus]|uniref:hypothetical protein n=1 Tax=Hymenobacter rubidus TaxID=1441626 RepID=UPI00191DE0B0|nr:hypothetical protein [Hymenobacter rubidus]
MGLHQAEIEFTEGVPSFQSISQQYKRQTVLDIELLATIHLATGEFGELLNHPSSLLSVLQADAATVAAFDTRYEEEKAPLILSSQYEKAAALRDRTKEEKARLNHISSIEIRVDYGDFYPIQITVRGQTIEVDMYYNQYYAVASLIKSLVDLGGVYQWAGEVQKLSKSWQKLKKWEDYKWYNRPKK